MHEKDYPDAAFGIVCLSLNSLNSLIDPLTNNPIVNSEKEQQLSDMLPKAERDGEFSILLLKDIYSATKEQLQRLQSLLDTNADFKDYCRKIYSYKLPDNWLIVSTNISEELKNPHATHALGFFTTRVVIF